MELMSIMNWFGSKDTTNKLQKLNNYDIILIEQMPILARDILNNIYLQVYIVV